MRQEWVVEAGHHTRPAHFMQIKQSDGSSRRMWADLAQGAPDQCRGVRAVLLQHDGRT